MASEKLIRTKELKEKLKSMRQWFGGPPQTDQDKLAQAVVKMCIEEVDKLKPVDAVEVVRCKDCIHYIESEQGCNHFGYYSHTPHVDEDDFCSCGERRTDG